MPFDFQDLLARNSGSLNETQRREGARAQRIGRPNSDGTAFRVRCVWIWEPRVALPLGAQPWADRLNAVGVSDGAREVARPALMDRMELMDWLKVGKII